MEVKLIAYTQPINKESDTNPLSIVEQAACICYDSQPTENFKIAKGCRSTGHKSVFEHVSFTFKVSGVSRALLAQLSRHRHISLSVQSQRYVSLENFDYVNPFSEDSDASNLFDKTMKLDADVYKAFTGHGVKNEDARAVLPNACCTEFYLTLNARSLMEMSNLRMCSRAQKEIRDMFMAMKAEVSIVAPEIANWMVPSCEINPKYPFCPEGNRCCGRHPKLSDVYRKEESNEAQL